MSLFNSTSTISLSRLQNSVFVNGEPLCDLLIQKGINYKWEFDNVDKCLWATFNKEDTDLVKTVPGTRKISLTEEKFPNRENCIIVKSSFDVVLESVYDGSSGFAVFFDIVDFVSNKTVVGASSNAQASIKSFYTSSTGKICLEYETIDGQFEYGEDLRIIGTDGDSIRRFVLDSISNHPSLDTATKLLLEEQIETPYKNATEQEYLQCQKETFSRIDSTAFGDRIEFDSFSRQVKIERACVQKIKNLITLEYSPNLLCFYDRKTILQWDSETIDSIEKFPFVDFLTGQEIRGWHSQSTATVEKISLQYKNGNRYIVAQLSYMSNDFQADEPIEVTSITQNEILSKWGEILPQTNLSGNQEFIKCLRTFARKPFHTSSIASNAICTGMLEDSVNNASKKIGISLNGCQVSNENYSVEIAEMSDFLKDCSNRGAYHEKDMLVYYLVLGPEIHVSSQIRIKTNIVDYVEGNGSNTNFNIRVDPANRIRTFYVNDSEYTLEPLEITVIDQSQNSRAFTLDDIIQEPISREYPEFYNFMKYHFAYSHSIGNGKYFLNNSNLLNSIDCTPNDLLDELAKETLGPLWCEKDLYKSRSLQKEFVNFWNYNGTNQGIEYLFNVMCWPKPTIYVPCDITFEASGDDTNKSEYIYAINSAYTISPHDKTLICDWDDVLICDVVFDNIDQPYKDFDGYEIKGAKSRSIATLENSKGSTSESACSVSVMEISHRVGQFTFEEKLELIENNDKNLLEVDWSKYNVNQVPSFIENVANHGYYLLTFGGVPNSIEIYDQEGEFCLYERLRTNFGRQEGTIYVDCMKDGKATSVGLISECDPNIAFPDSLIELYSYDEIGNVKGILYAKVKTSSVSTNAETYSTNTSLTNDISALNDNYLLDPNSYILSTPINRKEYIDLYNNTVREAGTYVFSEYPISNKIVCKDSTLSFDQELLPVS